MSSHDNVLDVKGHKCVVGFYVCRCIHVNNVGKRDLNSAYF